MKAFLLFISTLLLAEYSLAQRAEVKQLEHSLRWLSEANFPNYLNDPIFEKELMREIEVQLAEFTKNSEVILPEHFNYRLISAFGKSKIKAPKSSSSNYAIAITSSISRGTTNYGVIWNMQVHVRIKDRKQTFDREVEHELEPFSVSLRVGNMSWMTKEEFKNAFVFLLEECLGTRTYSPDKLTFGSTEIFKEKVEQLISIDKEYQLVVAGAMMEPSSTSYLLMHDSITINEFTFKSRASESSTPTISSKGIFANLFSQITNIDTYYRLDSKETRNGVIIDQNSEKRKVRLNWLAEVERSTDEEEASTYRIMSPITGEYFDGDSLIANFIYYEEVFEQEQVSLHEANYRLSGDFTKYVYSIVGEYSDQKFEVVYRAFDKMILVKVNNEILAVCSLINLNPESRSAEGVRFSKNMVTMSGSTGNLGTPKIEYGTAEWYPIYTIESATKEGVVEMGYFLLLLFFAIGHSG